MKHPRPQRWLLLLSLPLLALLVFIPTGLRARSELGVADFQAPISAEEARARVSAAQQAAQAEQRRLLGPLAPTGASNLPLVQTVYVGQTGFHVSDRAGFLTFWRERGGVLVFGYPISEELVEDGQIVQYFERARFEYHPEHLGSGSAVQLSLLGRELTAGQTFADGAPENGQMYFVETKHTLSGKFLQFWLKRGGLEIFGFPISEPFEEVSEIDGQTRVVQYFERARFEYFPEELGWFYQQQVQAYGLRLAALHEVRLSDLGRQAAGQAPRQFAQMQQLAGAPEWSTAIWPRRIDVDLTAQHLVAYEGDTPVFRAPIATGRDGFNTPTGSYAVYLKLPMQDMSGSAGGESWYVPNIPWVQYIVGGVALHGTYWHDEWGTGARMSHGCINLNIDDAQWLYEWAEIGTQVDVHY